MSGRRIGRRLDQMDKGKELHQIFHSVSIFEGKKIGENRR